MVAAPEPALAEARVSPRSDEAAVAHATGPEEGRAADQNLRASCSSSPFESSRSTPPYRSGQAVA
jgi:hypothetical protein